MKIIRIFSSILSFIEINLIFVLVFSISNYIIFSGEEKTGTLVTIITVAFFILSIVTSSIITRKIYLYLKNKTFRTNFIFFIAVLIIIISTMLFLNLYSYILSVE